MSKGNVMSVGTPLYFQSSRFTKDFCPISGSVKDFVVYDYGLGGKIQQNNFKSMASNDRSQQITYAFDNVWVK